MYRKIDSQQIYYSPVSFSVWPQSVALALQNFDSDTIIRNVIETDAILKFAKKMLYIPSHVVFKGNNDVK